ncbi:MAG TPA: hypothetical protein VKN18_22990 [Blastocatellia bacterium]|nr:hypothetical protein [Blastocatellia bacterium]
MKLIAATFGDEIDDRSLGLAKLGAEARSTRNSWIESIDGYTNRVRFEPTSTLLTPSMVQRFWFEALPFTDISTRVSIPVPRALKPSPGETPGTIKANCE